ncbi:Cell cycle associated protein 1 [Cichlidogyrus casuarinus]|uniref:Cell cycle associated protein 1 n=1 Tax=Cichlidogyrus casuarinus TaxID=1844966 RepID=A0ABD2Q205_9PLAT
MSTEAISNLVAGFKETIDKKQRNLMKRKGKLDQYRGNLSRGETLQPDQAKAIQNYDTVRNNLSLIGEISENTSDFTKKMEIAIAAHDKVIKLMPSEASQLANARLLFFQNFLQHFDNQLVLDAVIQEYSTEYVVVMKNLAALCFAPLPQDEYPSPGESLEAFLNKSSFYKRSQLMQQLSTGSKQPVPDAGNPDKKTQYTFKDAHDICLNLMRNARVQHAIQGEPYQVRFTKLFWLMLNIEVDLDRCKKNLSSCSFVYFVQEKTNPILLQSSLTNEIESINDCSESMPSPSQDSQPSSQNTSSGGNQRFNFLQPSVVECAPLSNGSSLDGVDFIDVENDKPGEEWVNVKLVPKHMGDAEGNMNMRRSEPDKRRANRAPRGARRNFGGGRGGGRAFVSGERAGVAAH